MFLRGLWDISLNGDLIEISRRHLMPAEFIPQYCEKILGRDFFAIRELGMKFNNDDSANKPLIVKKSRIHWSCSSGDGFDVNRNISVFFNNLYHSFWSKLIYSDYGAYGLGYLLIQNFGMKFIYWKATQLLFFRYWRTRN